MAARSADDVKRDIESEREQLGNAVRTLRAKADAVRRKLPLVAVGAAAGGLVVRAAAKRFSRRAD